MKDLLIKKSLYIGSYIVAALIIEFITFNVIGLAVFPTYFWLDLAILLFIGAVIFIVPSFVAQSILICLMLLIQVVLAVVNEALYSMSNMVFSLTMLNLVKEVGGVFNNDFVNYFLGAGLLLIVVADGFLLWRMRKIGAKHSFKWQAVVLLLSVFCLTSGFSSVLYFVSLDSFITTEASDNLYIYKDDTYLFDTQFIGTKAYKKFGTFGFYYKNIGNFVSGDGKKSAEQQDEETALKALDDYLAEGRFNSDLDALDLTPYGGNGALRTGTLNGQNVVLVVIESGEWYAINGEYTPTLYALATQGVSMTQYYARDKTNHSEAMSILGSYPALIENTITSSVSNPQGLIGHSFDFSLPNILQEGGYTTNYFHANDGDYYGRNETFADLYGFDYAHFLDTMERLKGYYDKKEFIDLDRDSEVLSQYIDDFSKKDAGDENYFSMMMTLISHGSYNDLIQYGDYTAVLSEKEKEDFSKNCSVKGQERYYERIDDFPHTYVNEAHRLNVSKTNEKGKLTDAYLRYKRYQAGVMDLDVGVNRLIHQLEAKGELDDTAFVFYADHNCYYNQQNYLLKDIPTTEYWNTELYNIPFFIWSGNCMDLNIGSDLYKGLTYTNTDENVHSSYTGDYYYDIDHRCAGENLGGIQISKYCNSFDILPTLLDLLGYDFNLNLYQGVSVFKDAESVFISRESGMFDANIYSDGDSVFVKALPRASETDPLYSFDGQICFNGDAVSIRLDGEAVEMDASGLEKYLFTDSAGDYIVYDLDAILSTAPEDADAVDMRDCLSDGVNEFLRRTSEYYKKQEFLEMIYKYDYFRTRSAEELIFK